MRASSDRISALARMPVADLAALLERVPALAQSLDGAGPLAPSAHDHRTPVARTDRSLTHLGVMMASSSGISATVDVLNRLERQLLVLAAVHDGAVSREAAVAEAGDARELDQAVSALGLLLLVHEPYDEGEWLVLRPGVMRHVPLPGMRIYSALSNLSMSDLDVLLQRLGAEEIPYGHEDRRRLVGALLRRPSVAEGLYERLDPDLRRTLDLLVDHGSQRVADLGLPPFDPWDRRGGPLHTLVQHGLAGVDLHAQRAFSWLDLRVGLRGRLFDDWPLHPPRVEPAPLHDPGPGTPRVVRRLHLLLEHWATEPVPALASGGIGVRGIRAAAKGFGVDPGDVGLLTHLAIDLGLLGETDDDRWAPTPAAADFAADPPARQWAALVAAWRDATTVDEKAGLPNRWDGDVVWPPPQVHRDAVLDVLAALEEGTGVDPGTLADLCAWRYPESLGPDGADAIVQALRLLDLVPADGAVGLTAMARALRRGGVAEVERVMGPVAEEVVVQADHSVIAPPGLAPRVAAELAAIAELESDAGAQIWRITAAKVGEAMADGRTRDQIVDFLTSASSVPPPANVLVTVDDVAARHGRLRAGTIGSYLRGDDPADLTAAAAVSGAKLRVLSPTVAVSPLSRDALIAALRGRGLLAVAEDAGGATLPPRRSVGQALEGTGIPESVDAVPPDPFELAQELQAEGLRRT
ncbi:helicase-associated domain-containing protein [Euzebya sp.]|uniref:helicase-associated domain-containing protein n=1 Tax=Euzebya sp. TaxID=1971409 RepID=UPI003513CC90